MAGASTGRSLEETPTWAVAVVCFFLVLISIIIEHVIHLVGKWLKKRHKRALYEALEKIKSELMLLGFVSLLLTVGQSLISNICIPTSVAATWHPCSKVEEENLTPDTAEGDSSRRRLLLALSEYHSGGGARRSLAGSESQDKCAAKGKVAFVSKDGIHQLHIFIFVLALSHVLYCIITLALSKAKMRRWKKWEKETKTIEYHFSHDPERFRFTRETSFGRRHLNLWTNNPVLIWIEGLPNLARRKISKIATKTIVDVHGDVYDCVHMYKQPAFGDPKFKSHKIQARPSKKFYEAIGLNPYDEKQLEPRDFGFEKGCPKGFVPIQEVNSASILQNYSHSSWQHGAERAGLMTSYSGTHDYYGARAFIGLYNPKLYGDHEYSSSIITMIGGESEDGQIIAGWTVNPDLNKDTLTRLIIGWTNDQFKSIGCYNLLCSGFVLIANTNPIGASFGPISTDTKQYDMNFLIAQDPRDLKWWFFLSSSPVGYWPHWLFIAPLQQGANKVYWGGVVYTPPDQDYSPQMGSGRPKYPRSSKLGHMQNVEFFDSQSKWLAPDNSVIEILQSRCYIVANNGYRNNEQGYYFRYGGRGKCLME